jgi:secreted PhoX family phosphatase
MGIITDPDQSPFTSGTNYGMRLGTRSGNTDYGQGSETGEGIWIQVDGNSYMDSNGNIKLRNAQTTYGLTGYYRPEDMELDPMAAEKGIIRICWTNTGRMTNGWNSEIENGHNYGEVLCLVDEPQSNTVTDRVPVVTHFLSGDRDANHFDNIAFQPKTGNMVLLEDGEVEVLNADNTLKELRGNDIWMCLSDGADRNAESDGCIRIASLKDTDAEPTGFIFDASGKNAFVNIMHRATGQGALLKIYGFKITKNDWMHTH